MNSNISTLSDALTTVQNSGVYEMVSDDRGFAEFLYRNQELAQRDENGTIENMDTLLQQFENPAPRNVQAAVNAAASLDELCEILRDASEEETERVDLTSLPSFGGTEPSDTVGIWSWDESRLLVSESRDGSSWGVIERTAATWLPEYADDEA